MRFLNVLWLEGALICGAAATGEHRAKKTIRMHQNEEREDGRR